MADDLRFDIILNDAKAQASLKRLATSLDKSLKGATGLAGAFLGASKALGRMNKQLKTSDKLLKSMSKDLKNLAKISAKLPGDAAKHAKQIAKLNKRIDALNTKLKKQVRQGKKVTNNFKNQAAAAAQVSSGLKGGLALLFRYGPAAAAAAAGIASIAVGVKGFKALIQAGTESQDALVGLQSVAANTGQDIDKATAAAERFAGEGLISIKESATALKNLLAKGFNIDESVQLIESLRDAAAFGKQAHLEFGEAIAGATEGIKNDNSVKADNAGITENLSVMVKRYAKELGKIPGELTRAEKNQAILNGFLREGALFAGNFAIKLGTFSGIIEGTASRTKLMVESLGRMITTSPAVIGALQGISAVIIGFGEGLDDNQDAIRQFIKSGAIVLVNVLADIADGVDILTGSFEAFSTVFSPIIDLIGDLKKETGKSLKNLSKLDKIFKRITTSLSLMTSRGDKTTTMVDRLVKKFGPFLNMLKNLITPAGQLNSAFDLAQKGLEGLSDALEFVSGQSTLEQAREETARYQREVDAAADSTSDLVKTLGQIDGFSAEIQSFTSIEFATDSFTPLINANDRLAAATQLSTDATKSNGDKLRAVSDNLKNLTLDPIEVSSPKVSKKRGAGSETKIPDKASKTSKGPKAFNFSGIIAAYEAGRVEAERVIGASTAELLSIQSSALLTGAARAAENARLLNEAKTTVNEEEKANLLARASQFADAAKSAGDVYKKASDELDERASEGFGKTAGRNIIEAIDSIKSDVDNALKAALHFSGANDLLSEIGTTLSGVWDALPSLITGPLETMKNLTLVAFEGMAAGLQAVLGTIKNTSDQEAVDVANTDVSSRSQRVEELRGSIGASQKVLDSGDSTDEERKKAVSSKQSSEKLLIKEKEKLTKSSLTAEKAEKDKVNKEGARTFISAAVSGIADSFIPGLGSALGPVTTALLAGPDAIKEQLGGLLDAVPALIEGLVDGLPVIIEVLVEKAPAIILALVRAVPKIIDALIDNMDEIIIALVEAMPEIALALAEAMPKVAFALATLIPRVLGRVLAKVFDNLNLAGKLKLDKLGDVFKPFTSAVEDITGVFKNFRFPKVSGGSVGIGGGGGELGKVTKALGFATGGQVVGPGNGDTVPALLTPGELVVDRTTGPRLNKFIDSFEQPQQAQAAQSDDSLILAQILAALEKEQTINTTVELNQEALANIILSLNQDNQRTE